MTCQKHRYIALQLNPDISNITPSSIIDLIRKQLERNYGEVALSKIDCLKVAEQYEQLNVVIIKVNVEAYKNTDAIIRKYFIRARNGNSLKCLTVSGIIKKVQLKMLKVLKDFKAIYN